MAVAEVADRRGGRRSAHAEAQRFASRQTAVAAPAHRHRRRSHLVRRRWRQGGAQSAWEALSDVHRSSWPTPQPPTRPSRPAQAAGRSIHRASDPRAAAATRRTRVHTSLWRSARGASARWGGAARRLALVTCREASLRSRASPPRRGAPAASEGVQMRRGEGQQRGPREICAPCSPCNTVSYLTDNFETPTFIHSNNVVLNNAHDNLRGAASSLFLTRRRRCGCFHRRGARAASAAAGQGIPSRLRSSAARQGIAPRV